MTTTATEARSKFNAMIESRTLDQSIATLTLNDESTVEGMMVRVALINHIEKISPAIAAWVADFYDKDDDHTNWDIDYRDAILLAHDETRAA